MALRDNTLRISEPLVDALEDGRIVRVPESYAFREGLFILRRVSSETPSQSSARPEFLKKQKQDDTFVGMHELRRPLRMRPEDLTSSLIDTFHWVVAEKRRKQGLTRKQLAYILNVTENDLKLIENGVLPSKDYVLIRKLEEYFNINLRKDQTFGESSIKDKENFNQPDSSLE